jgi:hypothetical protein
MKRLPYLILAISLFTPTFAFAEGGAISSAESAGPASLSKNATIKDWNMKVLRKGTNEWTCLPDNPGTPGTDPWCMNDPWLNLLDALTNKKNPTYTKTGIAYMLQGDTPVSNTDPYAKEPKPGDDWVEGLQAHMMMLLPDRAQLKHFPTNSKTGGPWVMWPDTPYAHLMLPIDSYPAAQ